ncbi:sodium-dependent nutrient amino acid transporter 1-like [Prorops nasuta]|uniref:sodium-dependent nutrient amino acid transporter 1-like n=1 Tax=Prorops nasuta TaxID=863751 RepID=UPI0034CD1309
MGKTDNGVYKPNVYTNEAFQMDSFQGNPSTNSRDRLEKELPNVDMNKKERGEWSGDLEFLMACIATSVGLGNVWRFPFTAYENGGGAFLIPYIIVLFFIGKPFYYLEGILGQFTSNSCVKTWAMVPAMKGLGYGQAYAAFCVLSYYCSLMALTIHYLFASFQSTLPWTYCRPEWEGHCISAESNFSSTGNSTVLVSSSAELYFRRIVLRERDSIEDGIGLPSWELSLCLLLSWACIFFVLCRGVSATGRAVYFLAIFPYVIMLALLIRAVTLEGAANGILFFVTPKWQALLQPNVWYAAITQCFFSLSVCFGPISTYSSYNNFAHKLDRDVLIVTSLDTATSFMAGCTIFGILGNLAHELGTTDVSRVVRGGTGLAFISYPDALSRFSFVPQFFSVLFFVMLFVLGTGSAVALTSSVFSILNDYLPNVKQWISVLLVTIAGYLFSLVYITPGGQWFVNLVDYYGGTFVSIIVGVLEMITIFWIYGLRNFLNDVEFMIGSRPSVYWRVCWLIVAPVLMIVILIYTIATYVPPTYDGMIFPDYAYGIGWTLLSIGILLIVGWIVQKLLENKSLGFVEMFKAAFGPSETKWGPKDPRIRQEWIEFKSQKKFRSQGGLVETFFR